MSNVTSQNLKVIHDEDNNEFYIKMGRDKAYLQYESVNENPGGTGGGTVDLLHTVVPEAFRGQGVGKVLAKAAFEHFVNDRQQMKLTCWYLKKYYNDNQTQYQNHVIN